MEKLSRKQRHRVYKRALDLHIDYKTNDGVEQFGLCTLLLWSMAYLGHNFPGVPLSLVLPEFANKKPKGVSSAYWWPTDHDDPNRERVLRELIRETKLISFTLKQRL